MFTIAARGLHVQMFCPRVLQLTSSIVSLLKCKRPSWAYPCPFIFDSQCALPIITYLRSFPNQMGGMSLRLGSRLRSHTNANDAIEVSWNVQLSIMHCNWKSALKIKEHQSTANQHQRAKNHLKASHIVVYRISPMCVAVFMCAVGLDYECDIVQQPRWIVGGAIAAPAAWLF